MYYYDHSGTGGIQNYYHYYFFLLFAFLINVAHDSFACKIQKKDKVIAGATRLCALELQRMVWKLRL
jgi:hypothetical protein